MTSQHPPRAQTSTTSEDNQTPAIVDQKAKSNHRPFLSPQITSYFIAGGVAGATSRTVVSPLERLKIIQYVLLYKLCIGYF